MKKYKYNQYTLRLDDTLNLFLRKESEIRGLSETKCLRLILKEYIEHRQNEKETL